MGLGEFFKDRRMLRLLLGTAGAWFLFDYAYYGNTLSLPSILKSVAPGASLEAKLAWTLGIFVVFALPGYLLAVAKMDRIGHRRLQFIGFAVMARASACSGSSRPDRARRALPRHLRPELLLRGVRAEHDHLRPALRGLPRSMRTTGHGIAAGIGKLGAFIGVFLVPQLQKSIGLRGMLGWRPVRRCSASSSRCVLPEPARRTLEEVSGERRVEASPAATAEPEAGIERASA